MPFVVAAASPIERFLESLLMRPLASRRLIDAVVEYEPDTEHALTSLRAASEARLAEIERLELATSPRRHRVLRERLSEGRVGLDRALRVVRETRDLPDEVVAKISGAVLAPAPDGSVPYHRLFTSRLRRCVRSADTRAEGERRASAVARRCVHGRLLGDGTGFVTIVASAERVVGVLPRVADLESLHRACHNLKTARV